MAALTEHWDDVVSRLGAAKSEELRGFIAAMGGPDHKRAVARIADLVVEELPPEHPVRRALVEGYLLTSATLDWSAITQTLHGKAVGLLVSEEHPSDLILRSVADRLLRAPALDADQVRQRGADPGDAGLIRLSRADGSQQWPAFPVRARWRAVVRGTRGQSSPRRGQVPAGRGRLVAEPQWLAR